ncbi:hypothetical protein HY029_05400 [Candidatus Gottesmanbacteria bacterium]|nr:hypothetical protein [Candidatus Gottesmanbacteria bacterium]
MNKAKASCPAGISFLFKVCPHRNLLKMGSIGVSCTIDKKVEVEIEKAQTTKIIFNDKLIKFPTVSYVINKLAKTPVLVSIKSSLPLGYGFSISGASSLATASALNKLFNHRKTKTELSKIAHVAEIVNHTGLGSVGTQITGGFLLKRRPGLPVSAINLPFAGKKLYAVIIDKLLTPSILQDKKRIQKVNATTDFYLQKLKDNKSLQLGDVIDTSFDFVEKTGLLRDKRVISVIDKIKMSGGHATMAILGRVVISDIPFVSQIYQVVELIITEDFAKLS